MTKLDKIPIADIHCDTVMGIQRGYDIAKRNDSYHIDIPRLQEGGVKLQVFACSSLYANESRSHYDNINRQIDLLSGKFEQCNETVEICKSSADITRVNSEGKIAAVIAIEGGQALENNPANIEYYYNRDVRLITIAHEGQSEWCYNHKEKEQSFDGLNELGKEIIAEMNRLGIIIDLSHSSDPTAAKVLELSNHPVVASHSNARALCNHTRNLPDSLIKGIAESGGLIGTTFVNNFISKKYDDAYEEFWGTVPPGMLSDLLKLFTSKLPEEEYRRALAKDFSYIIEGEKSFQHLRTSVKDIVDHLDYITGIAGEDHVGIGSDFDGISSTPVDMTDCSMMQNLIVELRSRKHTDDVIRNIAYNNFVRLFKDVCG